jgi:hypothetical protein
VFVEVTMTRRNTPTRVDLLPPGRTEIIPGDRDNPIRAFKVTLADGTIRYLEREQVLWFRKPHPTDPFGSMTPLEAAGLATELDFFADLYNRTFLANDGRPGGILAVRNSTTGASMSEKEMDRIEDRFGKGPLEAGKMTVISGDMSFVDPSANPRDVAYGDLSDRAKTKILTAFGLDESIVGDTSGKTYANAEQAWENFWLLDPMPGHMRMVSAGWARLPGLDDLRPGFDTAEVEPLRRAKAARLEEARAEVEAGLRSIKSYATLAGYGDEIDDSPQVYALWIPQGRTPIPGRAEDAAALGTAAADSSAPAGQGAAPVAATVTPAAVAAAPAPSAIEAPQGRSASDILAAAGSKVRPPVEVKALPRQTTRPRPRLTVTPVAPAHSSEPDDETSRAAEDHLAEALAVLSVRLIERTVARLQGPKERKGTRHWAPQYDNDTRLGTKALDTARVVDEDTWAEEAQTIAQPYVAAAAATAANATAADLTETQGAPVLVEAAVTAAAVAAALDLIGASARRQARRLADVLNVADQAGQAIETIVDLARDWGSRLRAWGRGLATQATIAVIEGARSAAIQDLINSGRLDGRLVRRTWLTRHDERVRPSHRKAQGQTVPLGRPFVVGGALLRYPGDPLAPPAETANCRCSVLVTVGVSRVTLHIAS